MGLIVILLSTLFVAAAPAANAGTLAWSVSPTPDTLGYTNQVLPVTLAGLDVAFLRVAPNGDLFATDNSALNGYGTGSNVVYKSVNGGTVWTASAPILDAGSNNVTIVDIKVSPSYATDHTVFALANAADNTAPAQVYISVNSGLSFSVLGGSLPANEVGTSLAIAPNYSGGTGEVMVGTMNPSNVAYGNVYIWGRNGVLNWVVQGLPTSDVTAVAYSPNYAIDATRLAVSSNDTKGTVLNTLVATDSQWNTTISTSLVAPWYGTTVDAAISENGSQLAQGDIWNSVIAFPSDFNASSPYTRTCYVGVTSNNTADNVYSVVIGYAATATSSMANYGIGAAKEVTSLAYAGTSASGTLFFGSKNAAWVLSTATPVSTAYTWVSCAAFPTGASNTYIALANDYATSHKVYVGTAGAESALSISDDGGVDFYQAGLIDTVISFIADFQVANATTFYMATTNINNSITSVWKTADSGATWYRYLIAADLVAFEDIIRISPNYATDYTVVLGIVGEPPPYNLYVSNNAGTNWTAKSCPVVISDIAIKDQFTYYVGDAILAAAKVQSTSNGGWTWQPAPTTVSTGTYISSLKIDLATGALLASDDLGGIYLSTDSNVSWVYQGTVGSTAAIVAFDANYATNGLMYAIPRSTTGDVYRLGPGYALTPLPLNDGVLVFRDLLSTPDGSLYVTSNVSGVNRSINPSAGYPTLSYAEWDNMANATSYTPTFTKLAFAPGSNVIYGVATDEYVYVYTDTLSPSTAAAVPVPVSPAEGTVFAAPTSVVIAWNAVAGATMYQYMYDTRPDWITSTTGLPTTYPFTSAFISPLASGVTYYWAVRAYSPVIGPWSTQMTFLTELGPTAPNSPAVLPGDVGTTGPGGTAVALSPTFNWSAIGYATGYEFQLAKDSAMTNFVVDATGANALPATTAYKLAATLGYSTTYFWKVRGISATSYTDWTNVMAFTTLALPEASAPPVIITQAPAVTVSTPQATSTQIVITQAAEKTTNPTYIWAIIIIGAVLVLAVIILIVRTRRSV
jgi:hypothetical protein